MLVSAGQLPKPYAATVAVQRLEAGVRGGDDALHHLGRARDDPGPGLAGGALRLDGAGHHVELHLARIPERDVHARGLARAIGADVRRQERRREALVLAHERILVLRVPLAFARQRRDHPRLQRRRRPADLGIDQHGARRRIELGLPEILGDVLGAGVAGDLLLVAHHEVERREGDGLDRLHAIVADPRHRSHPVDRPLHQRARPRDLRALRADPRRVQHAVFFRERQARHLARSMNQQRLPIERDGDVARERLARGADPGDDDGERAPVEPAELPHLLEVGDRVLRALEARPVARRGAPGEIDEVHRRRSVGERGTSDVRGVSVGDEGARLVGAARLGEVVAVADREQHALGREARLDEEEIARLPGRGRRSHQRARGPESGRAIDPHHVVGRPDDPPLLEHAGERRSATSRRIRAPRHDQGERARADDDEGDMASAT